MIYHYRYLIKYFQIMDSKKIIIFLLLVLFMAACRDGEDDLSHNGYFYNTTNDTVFCFIEGKDKNPDFYYDLKIPPETKKMVISSSIYTTIENLKLFNNREGIDSVMFYTKNDTVIWHAPFKKLPDSIHSFYNENSWDVRCGGKKHKYVTAVFTITEADFK